jgi:hypothetical protein
LKPPSAVETLLSIVLILCCVEFPITAISLKEGEIFPTKGVGKAR